ncbi:hypothetical protein H0V99_00240 [Candidatus Saccharibacteria bacterium]|nr:hypothetical protein [Candidatus Saccharibacteria bacterium]
MNEALNADPYHSLETSPELVASEQLRLADEWARIYGNPTAEGPDRSAEIILRNPAVYLNDVDMRRLPEHLQSGWKKTLQFAEDIARIGATKDYEWSTSANSLEKVQSMVFCGEMNLPGSVSDLMREAAGLFAQSTKYDPGNTSYYAGNIRGASGWLTHATNS